MGTWFSMLNKRPPGWFRNLNVIFQSTYTWPYDTRKHAHTWPAYANELIESLACSRTVLWSLTMLLKVSALMTALFRSCCSCRPYRVRVSIAGGSYSASICKTQYFPPFFFSRIPRASGSYPGAMIPSETCQNNRTLWKTLRWSLHGRLPHYKLLKMGVKLSLIQRQRADAACCPALFPTNILQLYHPFEGNIT